MTTLEYLGALDDAAELEQDLGDPVACRARPYPRRARPHRHLRQVLERGARTLADNPDQKIFSQQANILAVLYDVIPKEQSAGMCCAKCWPSSRAPRPTA